MFRQVLAYVGEERPDALVIAGDIYDRAVPGVEAVRLFDDFLTDLAGENVTVIIISGNHDSPERTSFASRLLADKKLFLYGRFDGTVHKVSLPDEYGEVHFWLLPFIKPLSVRPFFAGREPESYGEALSAVLENAGIDHAERNVLVSHQYYTKAGVRAERSESELDPVGGLDAIDSGPVERFDYVALGHLHGAQSAGAPHVRYAGSPLKYSFSECLHEKSASLIAIKEKGDLEIRTLPFKPLQDMRIIKGKLENLLREAASGPADPDDYVRAILLDEEEIVDPMGKLRGAYPNIMSLDFENSRTGIDVGTIFANEETAEELSPYRLFRQFFLETQGSAMSAEQEEIVQEIFQIGEEE